MRFFDDRSSVGAVGHERAAVTTAQAVQFLFDRKGVDARLSLPWGPGGDDAPALLRREAEDAYGEALELPNGWVVDAAVGVETARDAIDRLGDRAGLRVMFQGEW